MHGIGGHAGHVLEPLQASRTTLHGSLVTDDCHARATRRGSRSVLAAGAEHRRRELAPAQRLLLTRSRRWSGLSQGDASAPPIQRGCCQAEPVKTLIWKAPAAPRWAQVHVSRCVLKRSTFESGEAHTGECGRPSGLTSASVSDSRPTTTSTWGEGLLQTAGPDPSKASWLALIASSTATIDRWRGAK